MRAVANKTTVTLPDRGTKRSLNYWWRLFATGFSFQVFGIGGALLATGIALPFLLVPPRLLCRKKAMRHLLSYSFYSYIYLLKWLGLLTFEIQGKQNLRRNGQLIIANHPSLLDVVFTISLVRNADCIVRAGLCSNPLTAAPVRAAGYVKNVPEQLLQRAVASLAEGNSLLVFPEGTRTKPGKPMKFLRGAANIAWMAKINITPVVITCEPATLLKHERWYSIPERPPHYTIRVLPDIDWHKLVSVDMPQSKAARVLTRHLEQLFRDQITSITGS
jgi:1-acyl-sn-glycerol-3-phosphate acyltransferase